MNEREEFDDLWTDYLEGELGPKRISRLNELLEKNLEWRKEAVDSYQTHRLLGLAAVDHEQEGGGFVGEVMATLRRGEEDFVEGVVRRLPESRSSRAGFSWKKAVALAACVGFLSVLGAVLLGKIWTGDTSSAPIATVEQIHGQVRWIADGGLVLSELAEGADLRGGTLETLSTDAWVLLRFLDGTTLEVSGPSLMTVADFGQKEIHLRRGVFSADVAPQPEGAPLRILTPAAEAEVLGTQLDVVADGYATKVTVNEGLVRVTRRIDGEVEEVPADHLVVAAMESKDQFTAVARDTFSRSWRSGPRSTAVHGEWVEGGVGEAVFFRAMPKVWNPSAAPGKGITLHLVCLRVPTEEALPVRLSTESRFRIRGTVREDVPLILGLTLNHAEGGFAGKYVRRKVIEEWTGPADSEGRRPFDISVPVGEFIRIREAFPPQAAGLDLLDSWALTLDGEAGLEVVLMEITDGSGEDSDSAEVAVLLREIAALPLPEGYELTDHRSYIGSRIAALSDSQQERLTQLWGRQTNLEPEMPNRGASFVKILEYVRKQDEEEPK